MRGPRRLLPYAADSRRPVLAFPPLLLPGFLFLLRSKPGIVPRALTGIATAFPQFALHPSLCFHPFLLHYGTAPPVYLEKLILISF